MYNVSLNNKECLFDSADGFKSLEEALIWACTHNGKFNILIDEEDEDGEIVQVLHYAYNGASLKQEVGYMTWEYVKIPC